MTLAATASPGSSFAKPRGIGVLAIATGVAGFALLAIHPGGEAHDFAGVLREEAANRITDALVHGGFVVLLALQAVCYALLSMWLGTRRATVVAALVLFAFGAAFLSASMLIDGLLTPAVAARFVPKPDKIETARGLFVLMGLAIGILMPIGIAFQAAAIANWGWALTASGSRAIGIAALGVGAVMLVSAMAGFATMNALSLMAGIAGTAVWSILAGVYLMRGH